MYLKRLYIENYRSIRKLDLNFEKGKNVIVGKNNSGKSNIIKAIDLILGESSPTWKKSENITDNDFFGGETDEIFIWCELSREQGEELNYPSMYENCVGFKMHSRVTEWEDRKPKSRELLRHPIVLSIENHNLDSIFSMTEDTVGYDTEWIDLKKPNKKILENLLAPMFNFVFCFKAYKNTEGIICKDIRFLVREDSSKDWALSFRDSLRNELLQSAIIPSFRNPKDQLRITHYTWYGKLLREYIQEDDEGLNKAFDQVRTASTKLFEELQDKITCKKTQIAFPNTKISFQFNPDTKQDIYKSALIYVCDGFKSKLEEKGSGIQSAVIIGLFDYYIKNIAHTNSSLLAIEEPEIYLHPHGRRVISDRLDVFLEGDKNQVILTTHSSEFICSPHKDVNLIVVRKDKETLAKNFNFNDIKTKQILIKKQNAEMFFADAVILVEGADKYILEAIAEQFGTETKINSNGNEEELGENWLNDYNVSIINCGGKTEFWKYSKIFKNLLIPYLVISDFDFFRNGLNDYLTELDLEKGDLDTIKSQIDSTIKNADEIATIKTKCDEIKTSVDDDNLDDVKRGALEIQKIAKRNLGSYKRINQIDPGKQTDIRNYIDSLKEKSLFILSGELEDFYKPGHKPKANKEQGVIETISKSIEEDKNISEYVKIDEFVDALKVFIENCLKLELVEK